MINPVLQLESLNPELFTYERYEAAYWDRFEWDASWERKTLIKTIRERALGYCDGGRLAVRPRSEDYAVMFEDEYGKFWFHINKDLIDDMKEGVYDEFGNFDAKKAIEAYHARHS